MESSFDNYIKQLRSLENSENVASLKAIREMNESVLVFFPTILESINHLIDSNSATLDVIRDIKEYIPSLSNCKKKYNMLLLAEKSKYYTADIDVLLLQKDTLYIYESVSYESELSDMLVKNETKLQQESEAKEIEEKERARIEAAEEKKRQQALKRKEAAEYAKLPKQYLWLFLRDISAGEYITVYIEGVKNSVYSSHAIYDNVQGYLYNQSIELTNEDHIVSLVFQKERIKLEISVPKIDLQKEAPRDTIVYHVISSSWFKKWPSNPSKADVRAYLSGSGEMYGKKIKPQYQISQI